MQHEMTRDSSTKLSVRKKQVTHKAKSLAASPGKKVFINNGDTRFAEVIALIEAARARGYQAVNTEPGEAR